MELTASERTKSRSVDKNDTIDSIIFAINKEITTPYPSCLALEEPQRILVIVIDGVEESQSFSLES